MRRTCTSTPRTAWRCETRPSTAGAARRAIAIVRLPHLSNATDFRLLTWADWITSPPVGRLRFHHPARQQEHDRRSGLAAARRVWPTGCSSSTAAARPSSASAAAIRCSDARSRDPAGMESSIGEVDGLGLLPARTTLTREKRTRAVARDHGRRRPFGALRDPSRRDDARSSRGGTRRSRGWTTASADGVCRAGVIGTYLHGALEHPEVCARSLRHRRAVGAVEGRAVSAAGARGSSSTRGISTTSVWTETARLKHLCIGNFFCSSRRSTFGDPAGFSSPISKEPHRVLSTSVRHGGQVDHLRHLLNHQSCEGHGASRSASRHHRGRPRRVSRSRLRGGGAAAGRRPR